MTPSEKGQHTRAVNAIGKHLSRRGFWATRITHEPHCWTVEAKSLDDEIVLVAPDYRGILALIEDYR